jgi:hypothetical protein
MKKNLPSDLDILQAMVCDLAASTENDRHLRMSDHQATALRANLVTLARQVNRVVREMGAEAGTRQTRVIWRKEFHDFAVSSISGELESKTIISELFQELLIPKNVKLDSSEPGDRD